MTQRQTGVTLIELMIVVAIVAVIATFAYPSYQSSVREGRRIEAHTSLMRLQLAMEQMRSNCRFYAGAIGATDSCGSSSGGSTVAFLDDSDYYNFSITGASGNAYILTATAQGDQTNDTACTSITLNKVGTQAPVACW